MPVGDINSTAAGSGARYNDGKAPLELIPQWIIGEFYQLFGSGVDEDTPEESYVKALDDLGGFQMGGDLGDILGAIAHCCHGEAKEPWTDCAKVFDYGRRKYASWNWLKGMPWSVPIGCASRHLVRILEGEVNDQESGLPHRGHLICNLVMLAQYTKSYREGDDRPKIPSSHDTSEAKADPVAEDGGWIEWGGAPSMPADPTDIVDVKFRSGNIEDGMRAGFWIWSHRGVSGDIVAYRVAK